MKFQTLLSLLFVLCSFCLVTSCGGDEDPEPVGCPGVTTLDGGVKINGENRGLTVAQLLVTAGGAVFGDSYLFQIAGISSDCNEISSVSLNLSVDSGTSIDGTREIKTFFDANDGDVTGSFTSQIVEPLSQNLQDLVSGTVTFTSGADNTYTIDLSATTVTGDDIDLEITHTF